MNYGLIGLVGHAGAGKDTAAAALMGIGYNNLKFSGPLKAMTRALLKEAGVPGDHIERMIEGDLKEAGSTRLPGGHTPRYVMQTLGTEWGRNCMGDDFWVAIAARRARQTRRAVFSDCRFPNEVAMIRRLGGVIIKINRPGIAVDLSHSSEHYVASLEADVVFDNETETPAQFQSLIREWVEAELRSSNHY